MVNRLKVRKFAIANKHRPPKREKRPAGHRSAHEHNHMNAETYEQIIAFLRDVTTDSPWQGHVYAVGGCCRDLLMGREINDIDLAVDLPNGGVKLALWLDEQGLTEGYPTLFERYGTARLRLRDYPDYEIEMVQTRRAKYTEESIENGPEAVFGTVADDAMRRDLTVNSLFYDITRGEMLDITGHGIDDIRNKRLATPMSADDTFADDPVRMLRVVRMAAAFGWDIPKELNDAISENAELLKTVHVERSRAEFEKMITGPAPMKALRAMRHSGLLRALSSELERLTFRTVARRLNISQKGTSTPWHRAEDALQKGAPIGQPEVAWAVLLTQLFWEEEATRALKKHKPEKKEKKAKEEPKTGARGRRRKPFRELPVYERILRRLHHHSKFINAVGMLVENARLAERLSRGDKRSNKRRNRLIRSICANDDRRAMLRTFLPMVPVLDTNITAAATEAAIAALDRSEDRPESPTTEATTAADVANEGKKC